MLRPISGTPAENQRRRAYNVAGYVGYLVPTGLALSALAVSAPVLVTVGVGMLALVGSAVRGFNPANAPRAQEESFRFLDVARWTRKWIFLRPVGEDF